MDAIAHGASDGMRVSLNVIAMLIALLALIAMIDWILGVWGTSFQTHFICRCHFRPKPFEPENHIGSIFQPFALVMGVPVVDVSTVGALMGEKISIKMNLLHIPI